MKCAIIGGSTLPQNISTENIQGLNKLATYCAKNNFEILTGGCSGYPYLFGKMCIGNNVKVIGYSAARNEKEHIEVYHYPIDGCSSIFYLENEEINPNYKFLIRSLPLINNSDVIIAIEGNWGSLFELIAGIICGKKIIIWQGFGGVSDSFNHIYNMLSKECHYNYGEDVRFVNSTENLISYLGSMIKEYA